MVAAGAGVIANVRIARGVAPHATSPAEPLDQYRRLIESLTDYAIFSLDLEGSIVTWNEGAWTTFGYARDEVLGLSYGIIFTAEDRANGRPEREILAAREFGKTTVDGWHARKDGSRFWCTDTVQTICDDDGAITGFTKIVHDSTATFVAREAVRDSEERLRLLMEGITDYALFSIDSDGIVRNWNVGSQKLYGYAEADIVGEHYSVIYPHDDDPRERAAREIATATRDGRSFDESWHVRSDGARIYATGQMTCLRPGADGRSRGFVKIARDVTARRADDEKTKRHAYYDDLTGLPNRLSFADRLREAIARTHAAPTDRFGVIYLDLDRFKTVNDSLGHATADGLLVHVARTLERCVRPGDIVARLGGDEFTILIAHVETTADPARIATRIHRALQKPTRLDGYEVFTTASMGIAIGTDGYETAEQILRDADTAMYEAKALGRSRHVLFHPAMHAAAVALLDLQMDLRRAVAGGEFAIDYQPIVALADGRVTGFEALVRWDHPVRGRLLPDRFLAEAENIGTIVEIDRFVLAEACRQIRAWQLQCGDSSLTVSVNLSSKHFASEHLVDEIRDALDRNRLDPRSLKLEITETALMEHLDSTTATIANVDALGVELYIDDFGTGYSSLSYLARLPLRILKVDRSFVAQVAANPRSTEIARSIVTLAHNLGLKALAEGIERESQLETFAAFGCEFGQGFWFSPPVRADVARQLIGSTLPLRDEPVALVRRE